jgi:hypothetical protein
MTLIEEIPELEEDRSTIIKLLHDALRKKLDAGELSAKEIHSLLIEEIKLEQLRLEKEARTKTGPDTERVQRARSALTPHRGRMTRKAVGA